MAQRNQLKRFVVRKYIMATSAKEALSKEKNVMPDDVWVDPDWIKDNAFESKNIGYKK